MSDVVRLTLVSHAMTDAMAAGRFPADEPLNVLGRRQLDPPPELGRVDVAWCGPELRTRQTAELLGLGAVVEVDERLADVDHGSWRGRDLGDVGPDVATWLADPAAAPHGGESVVDVVARVGGWLDSLSERRGRLVAVTHPAVVRAAVLVVLEAPPASFWRIDVAPVGRTAMHLRGRTWTLRSTG